MEYLAPILKFVGGIVVAGGGLSLIVYQTFKHLAAKWLDSRFEERLQSLKHDQSKEIERLRLKIAMLLDRATKLHQHEFETLPEGWDKLNESFWAMKGVSLSLQTFPDLERMDSTHFEEFVDGLNFLPWEKRELRRHSGSDRNKFYQKQTTLRQLNETKGKIRDSAIFLSRRGIFVSPPILAKMKELNDMVWKTYVEFELNTTHEGLPHKMDRLMEFSEKGEPMLSELEVIVHQRLWPSENAV